MSKADSIKDIRFKLRKLCDITDELMENLTKLHDSVHNGSFIPETLNQKMTDGLRSISQLQTEIFQEYASLEIGDLPDYIEEMETVLSEYQKKLEEQERYQEAVRFFFSLHSDNKEIEDLLDARKEQLKQVSSIRDTESLLPYLLVKQVFEETDMQKKFTISSPCLSPITTITTSPPPGVMPGNCWSWRIPTASKNSQPLGKKRLMP